MIELYVCVDFELSLIQDCVKFELAFRVFL